MAILNAQVGQTGLGGVNPTWLYLDTTDTVSKVTTAGYLNGLVKENMPINNKMIAVVSTRTGATSSTASSALYQVQNNSGVWSLVAADPLSLANGDIFVGNASGVATAVPMSGDVGIVASGATTIQPNAITTSKINNAAVTLAKLSATLAPAEIVEYGAQYTTVGGAAAEAITVTGALSTDQAFVQLVNAGPNTVSVLHAVVTANTLTVTFSANPGSGAIINYQLLRVPT